MWGVFDGYTNKPTKNPRYFDKADRASENQPLMHFKQTKFKMGSKNAK